MAILVRISHSLPDGTEISAEGDVVADVVAAYNATITGLTTKTDPGPTPDPPPGG